MYIRRFISVLAAIVSVGVCLFITYISRDVDRQTILFNLAFLGIMLLMLLAVILFGMRRLAGVCRGLRTATRRIREASGTDRFTDEGRTLFRNDFLDDCYQQYLLMQKNNPDTVCDIRSFINEEAIDNYVRRSILELIPDILTSLGILGTFVGLMLGLREFDPSGYEQMAGSVSPLINGIKVAFITSIYGISLSLAYSFNLRSEFSNLSSLTEEFLDAYYLNVHPPYEMDSLSRLLGYQRSQEEMKQELTTLFVDQMAQSFEKVLSPAFDHMTDGINRVVDSFTRNQRQVMTQVCESMTEHMREELSLEFDRMRQEVSELGKAQENYVDFMDRSLVRMQQIFTSLQGNLSQATEYTSQALARLTETQNELLDELSSTQRETLRQLADSQNDALGRFSSAQSEALRINEEQKSTYQDYIRFMYQSIEKFSEVWEKNSQTLQAYSDEISRMEPVHATREMRQELSAVAQQLRELQDMQLKQARDGTDPEAAEQTRLLNLTLQKLDELSSELSKPFLRRYFHRK